MARRYTAEWNEAVEVGGLHVGMRLIRPEDKPLLVEGFERLSFASRRTRFMGARSALTPGDLKLFTEVDQENHLAIGALDLDTGRPVGVVRFIRAPGTTRAEAALTIVDAYQHHGLGAVLLDRLAAAALERGLTTLRFVMTSDNVCMRHLAERLKGRVVRSGFERGTMTVDLELEGADRGPTLRAG